MTNTDDLIVVLKRHLMAFDADTPVSAEWLASAAINEIDPEGCSPDLVSFGCNLQLRQMSRHLLAKTFDPIHVDDGQEDMFDGLQDRYPGVGPNKGKYVPRHMLSYEDRMHNISRLRKEAHAKLAHADALEAETNELISAGALSA